MGAISPRGNECNTLPRGADRAALPLDCPRGGPCISAPSPGRPLPAFVRAFSCQRPGSCIPARATNQDLLRPSFYTPAPEPLANEGDTDMTRTEFQNWAKMANLRSTAFLEAARMVLTGDMRPGDAAKVVGASPQAVANVLRKIGAVVAAAKTG